MDLENEINIKEQATYTPTKQNPCFYAWCSDFGSFGYENANIVTPSGLLDCCGGNYFNAVEFLHDYIRYSADNHKKVKYTIVMIDGSVDKHGDIIRKEVYSITGKQLLDMGLDFLG